MDKIACAQPEKRKDVSIASYIAVHPVHDAGKEIAVQEANV